MTDDSQIETWAAKVVALGLLVWGWAALFFNLKSRVEKIETREEGRDQKIDELRDAIRTVAADSHARHDRMESKIDRVLERLIPGG